LKGRKGAEYCEQIFTTETNAINNTRAKVTTAKVLEESKNIIGVFLEQEIILVEKIVSENKIDEDKINVIERRSNTHENDSIKILGVRATK
jgi:hypothetical protein